MNAVMAAEQVIADAKHLLYIVQNDELMSILSPGQVSARLEVLHARSTPAMTEL